MLTHSNESDFVELYFLLCVCFFTAGKLMFLQLPLIEIDGLCLVESNAQANYLGHKYGMLGNTNVERGM